MGNYRVPLIIRGDVIANADIDFGGRRGQVTFKGPDVSKHLDRLRLATPSLMADLYRLSFDEVLDYLDALADRLSFGQNGHLQNAFELSRETSGLTEGILRYSYENMRAMFRRDMVEELVENTIGRGHLDGWVETRLKDGTRVLKRAFGARTVHIVAGNLPSVSALSIVRNAITRGDALIKAPSNDPLTAAAIALTMIDMAPDHALTKHLSVAYWKGGDTTVEEILYQPSSIEKIVAWGGMASMKHIAKYIQPGIDLVALDPKLSSAIIGRAAFDDEATMRYVAQQIAYDVGGYNQEACGSARVVYVESGTDKAGLEKAAKLGEFLWDAIQALPPHISEPARALDPGLQEELDALRLGGSRWHKLIGGTKAGGVIVSQLDEPVDFAPILANRVVNLVPVDDLETPVEAVTAYTQTIGVYPEDIKDELRDRLALHGAQRLVSLGYGTAASAAIHGVQDATEPLRRMCKWVVDEKADRTKNLTDFSRM